MCSSYDVIVKEFQTNLASFVNAAQSLAVCTQNLATIMGNVDPGQTIVNKSVPALIDWSQNLYILSERFELDAKTQLSASLDKEHTQPEACSIRMTMGNIYEKVLFFLNHMTHSYIDYSRSESPMSASYECQVPNSGAIQRFRTLQQQQQYRRWSEAAAGTAMEANEANVVDSNRRWSMPTNVSKTQSRFIPMMNKLAGLVNQQSQTTIPDLTTNNSDGVNEAIQLLSIRPAPSRPPSQHCPQQTAYPSQTQHFRNQPQSQRQRQSRGELNEILVLPRANDPLYLGRYQQIVENIRGESDEY